MGRRKGIDEAEEKEEIREGLAWATRNILARHSVKESLAAVM
jgi:hypothetical protein